MKVVCLLILALAMVNCGFIRRPESEGKIRYDNYKVYKLFIKNKAQEAIVKTIQNLSDKYNIWKDYDEVSKEIHVMVKPTENRNLLALLDAYGLERELMVENVQEMIDEEEDQNNESLADNKEFGWTRYHQLYEIEAWLDEILAKYPTVTEGFVLGTSFEGREIRGIKISYKPGNPTIFIESNIHAREWITSASCTWFINQLLTSKDEEVRHLAEDYDWYIVPVFNVDGFVYSHVKDRMWRKTRQPVSTSNCIGTDANRNFDSHWMENGGASNNPCAETYAGTKAFSEPEAEALAKFVSSIKDKIKIYISFHSYGQYLLSPYGHSSSELPPNYDDLQKIGAAFVAAIAGLPYETKYTHGSTATALYVASGSSVDWAYNELGIKLGYTIEFRDKDRYGFVLPPVYILPNCEELMAGMKALISTAEDLDYV